MGVAAGMAAGVGVCVGNDEGSGAIERGGVDSSGCTPPSGVGVGTVTSICACARSEAESILPPRRQAPRIWQ